MVIVKGENIWLIFCDGYEVNCVVVVVYVLYEIEVWIYVKDF